MSVFLNTDVCKSLDVGVALGEHPANPTDKFTVFHDKQSLL